MVSELEISDVEVTEMPCGADLSIEANFYLQADQAGRSWRYKEIVHLIYSQEEEVYKMIVPYLCFDGELRKSDNYVTELPPKPEYIYSGNLEEILEQAKKDLHEAVDSMVSKGLVTANDYAWS